MKYSTATLSLVEETLEAISEAIAVIEHRNSNRGQCVLFMVPSDSPPGPRSVRVRWCDEHYLIMAVPVPLVASHAHYKWVIPHVEPEARYIVLETPMGAGTMFRFG